MSAAEKIEIIGAETFGKHPGIGLHEGISNYDYHSVYSGLSSTALKNYMPASPAPLAFKAGSNFTGSSSTNIGSAWHALNLEPLSWANEIQIMPEFKRGEKTKGKAELIELHPHITWIERDELEIAQEMHHVLQSHPEAKDLFAQIAEGGQTEVSGWYNDLNPHTAEGTFQLCKYRPDMRFCPDWTHNTWIADLKSCRDASPQAFSKAIQQFGYHISAAHYLEGDHILHGRRPKQFIFICQESEPPYLVAVYVLEEKAIQHGLKLRRRALEGIHHAKKTGEWPHYHYNKAVMIDLPSYVYNQEDFV